MLCVSKKAVETSGGSRGSSKKRRKRKTATPTTTGFSSDTGISEEDLADHVANMYIHGPGGILRRKGGRRDLGNTKDPAATATEATEEYESTKPDSVLNRRPSLVLNADYQPLSSLPLSLWNWQEAVKAVFSGKVTVVEVYPDVTIRAVNLEIPLPSVIALNEYVKPPKQRPAFTKRNVYLRDEYRCQYCKERFHTNDLSIDHVVPRSHGGRLHWENAVTCCKPCNGRKGSLRVEDLKAVGMRLFRKPSVPSQMQLASIAGRMRPSRGVHPTWEPFLGMMRNPAPKTSAGVRSTEEYASLEAE